MDGDEELTKILESLGIRLDQLVARLAIWAPIELVELLRKEPGNPNACWYPKTRRHRPGKELLGRGEDGIRLDRNNYANAAIKQAVGNRSFRNYHACHLWKDSCYDADLHTALPNLVLIPRALAGLSDFDPLHHCGPPVPLLRVVQMAPLGESPRETQYVPH